MADSDIEIPVGLETDGFTAGIDQVVDQLTRSLTIATAMEEQFRNNAKAVDPLIRQVAELNKQLGAIGSDAPAAEKSKLESLLASVKSDIEKFKTDVTRTISEMRTNRIARGRAEGDVLDNNTTDDGRTLRKAQFDEFGTKAFITGIRTTDPQRDARLKEEAQQAAERLLKTTEDALTARLMQSRVRMAKTVQEFSTAASPEAYLTQQEAAKNRAYLDRVKSRSFAMENRATEQEEREKGRVANQVLSGFGIGGGYALGTYAIGGVQSTVAQLSEFDDKLKQFQAITQTSNAEVGLFRDSLLSLGAASKYSVSALTEAAITIGQTGLSAQDTLKTLPAITNLATASGSTLGQATDVVTAVMGGYRLEASRATEVSNTLASSLNQTRLTMGQLSSAISYSVDVAHDAGVSFVELTASIGSVAQAGVRSGSTIGTGLRRIIAELSEPTARLQAIFRELNITGADIDIRSNGITGVLENLKAKGFTGNEALRGFDVRTASTFSALTNQIDTNKRLQTSLLLTDAAADGAAKANESLGASLTRLGNQSFAVLDKAFRPLLEITKLTADATAGLFAVIEKGGPALQIFTAGITALGVAGASLKVFALTSSALSPLISSFQSATVAGAGFSSIMLGLAANPLFLATSGLVVGAGLLYFLANLPNAAQRAAEQLDKLKAIGNDLASRQLRITTSGASITDEIDSLLARREKLNADPLLRDAAVLAAQKAFGDLGLSVKVGTTSVEDLIEALQKLRGNLAQQLPDIIGKDIQNVADQIRQLKILQEAEAQKNRPKASTGGMIAIGEADAMLGATGEALDPTRRYDDLGPNAERALDIIRNPKLIDPKDPRGSVADTRFAVRADQRALQDQIDEADRRVANGEASATRGLEELKGKLERYSDLIALLDKAVGTAARITAAGNDSDRKKIDQEAAYAKAAPQAVDLRNRAERLVSDENRDALAVVGDPTLEGNNTEKYARVRAVVAETNKRAAALEAELDRLIEQGKAANIPLAALKQAYAEISDKLAQAKASMTAELSKIGAEMKIGLGYDLRAKQGAIQADINLAQRRLSTTNNPETVAALEELIKSKQDEIGQIEVEIIKLRADNPEKLSEELKGAIRAAERKTQTDKEGTTESVMNRQKAIMKELLQSQERMLAALQKNLQTQIDALEKELKNPATPAIRLDGIQTAITGLRERSLTAKNAEIDTRERRESIDNPAGYARNADAVEKYPKVKAMLDRLEQTGNNDLAEWALFALGGESKFGTNTGKKPLGDPGARGPFQFILDTGSRFKLVNPDGSNDRRDDIDLSTDAFVAYTKKVIDKKLDQAGLDLTNRNRYALYNQGEGGGLALLKNPEKNAIETLRDFGVKRPEAHILDNLGNESDTGKTFIDRLFNAFTQRIASAPSFGKRTGVVAEKAQEDRQAAQTKMTTDEKGTNNDSEAAKRRALAIRLETEDRELKRTLDADKLAVSKGLNPDQLSEMGAKTIVTIGKLADKALEKDKNDKGDQGRSEAEKALARDSILSGYSETAQRQAIVNADAVGKATLKTYQDRVDALEDRLASFKKEANDNKTPQPEIDATKRDLIDAQEKLKVEGEYAATRARILELEKEIAGIGNTTLGESKTLFTIQQQILALKEKEARLKPQVDISAEVAAKPKDIGVALQGGAIDFMKSRGIATPLGGVVDQAEQARKLLSQSLTGIAGSFDNLFLGLATGTKKSKDLFADFAKSILQNLASLLSKKVTDSLFEGLFDKLLKPAGQSGDSGGSGGLLGMAWTAISSAFGGSAGKSLGGEVRMASGGEVPNTGQPFRDSVPILAQPGEIMMRKSAVDVIGRDKLLAFNGVGNRYLAEAAQNARAAVGERMGNGGNRAEANVYVLAPDQKPIPGPNDIVHIIASDMQRGGVTKQLIKRIQAG